MDSRKPAASLMVVIAASLMSSLSTDAFVPAKVGTALLTKRRLDTNLIPAVHGLSPFPYSTKFAFPLHAFATDEKRRLGVERGAKQDVQVKDEQKYAAIQGSINRAEEKVMEEYSAVTVEEPEPTFSELQKTIARITEPRAYPLFLLEKGALIVADGIADAVRSLSRKEEVHFGSTANGAAARIAGKKHLVVLGTGWGSAALLRDIDTSKYDVTIISPRNFFLFTPMLSGASVGTVEYRSITEPVRELNRKAEYLEAAATSIDLKTNTIYCHGVLCDDGCEVKDFDVIYDKLVVGVGAQTNTYGIPGVREYCAFLKQIEDARKIRRKVINCLERANYPGLSDEERRNILTFVVIGAGPTGIEFAAELRDFVEQDGPKFYPHLLKYIRIKVIDGASVILRPFDESLRAAAIERLTSRAFVRSPAVADLLPEQFELTEIILEKAVKEVTEDVIYLTDGTNIPYGLAVWAGGIGPLPFTLEVIKTLGEEGGQAESQADARGRIAVDPWLRALGGDGKIFAIGDCACTKNMCLPATAQVAGQQGEYLARLLSRGNLTSTYEEGILVPPTRAADATTSLTDTITAFAMNNGKYMAPFQFLNMGILAYIGGSKALAQVEVTPDEKMKMKAQGRLGFALWRSVYFAKQFSNRNRFLIFFDWAKSRIFGRDITSIE